MQENIRFLKNALMEIINPNYLINEVKIDNRTCNPVEEEIIVLIKERKNQNTIIKYHFTLDRDNDTVSVEFLNKLELISFCTVFFSDFNPLNEMKKISEDIRFLLEFNKGINIKENINFKNFDNLISIYTFQKVDYYQFKYHNNSFFDIIINFNIDPKEKKVIPIVYISIKIPTSYFNYKFYCLEEYETFKKTLFEESANKLNKTNEALNLSDYKLLSMINI